MCSIDISKAFDKISHQALFLKLIKRKTPYCLVKVLKNWYENCFCQVKWEQTVSKFFRLDHGIRQGGILSPFLFAVYVDDALCTLVNSDLGCNFYGLNFGAIMYADDILLLAGSIKNLQKLINLTEKCFIAINLKINIKKCIALRIGNRCKVACEDLVVMNVNISWKSEIKYLGITFNQAASIKINLHSNKVKIFYSFK